MPTVNNNIRCTYEEAQALTFRHMPGLPAEEVALLDLGGRVLAEDVAARVNSPSINCSLKDGYAVRSADIAAAGPENPVRLRLVGHASAGNHSAEAVTSGTAIRILSGAEIPAGADAVIAEEFTTAEEGAITALNDARPGRNILPKGSDIVAGEKLFEAGLPLRPTQIGLLAAAGYASARVYRRPRVAVIATGDEVIAPGMPLQHGKLFASNLVTLAAWCRHYSMEASTQIVPDHAASIRAAFEEAIATHDAIVTSGGAWKGERDLVARVLDGLGWTRYYHRVRLGPGKAVGFGLLEGKPVFCLPGGPPSNHAAFMTLALPGLMKLAGYASPGLPRQVVELADDLSGQVDWTQCIHGRLEQREDTVLFHSLKQMASRLGMMAQADSLVLIPAGVECIPAGTRLLAQVLA